MAIAGNSSEAITRLSPSILQAKEPCRYHFHPPRPAAAPPGDDKKQLEDKKPFQRPSVALRANRKARGLCVRCGDKWVPGHRCAPNLQLHVLQEVWDICHQDFSEDTSSHSGVHAATDLLAISVHVQCSSSVRFKDNHY